MTFCRIPIIKFPTQKKRRKRATSEPQNLKGNVWPLFLSGLGNIPNRPKSENFYPYARETKEDNSASNTTMNTTLEISTRKSMTTPGRVDKYPYPESREILENIKTKSTSMASTSTPETKIVTGRAGKVGMIVMNYEETLLNQNLV